MVADIGAGTGKLTRALVATGAEVVAVQPDADMATELLARVPGVETYLGSGEALPLADASMDAITYGQAWHWVDPDKGTAEATRVLRPGGVLALLWNVRDERVDWVARFIAIMGTAPADGYLQERERIELPAPFGVLEEARFEWSAPMTAATILDLARSRSTFIIAEPAEQERIVREVGALTVDLGLGGDATIDFPYLTRVFRAIRP